MRSSGRLPSAILEPSKPALNAKSGESMQTTGAYADFTAAMSKPETEAPENTRRASSGKMALVPFVAARIESPMKGKSVWLDPGSSSQDEGVSKFEDAEKLRPLDSPGGAHRGRGAAAGTAPRPIEEGCLEAIFKPSRSGGRPGAP